MEVGPIDPAATFCRLTAQAIAARTTLVIYLTDRAAAKASHNLIFGTYKDIQACDLLLVKGHTGSLDSPVAEIHDQADPVRAIGVQDAHIADGPQHQCDQYSQKAESRFAHKHHLPQFTTQQLWKPAAGK
jgi:hypothetical protein